MAAKNPQAPFILVADTNLYAGNFERDFCGYVTGTYGECGVGAEEAALFVEELTQAGHDGLALQQTFTDMVSQEPDDRDYPCYRPASIWPTPGRWNNGSGQHFDDAVFDPKDSWQGQAWPAYESVAIFFQEQPSPALLELIVQRATMFVNRYNRGDARWQFNGAPTGDNRMTLKGLRLIDGRTKKTLLNLATDFVG